MKMVKSLLLGSAAGLVAMAGAQAADLPVKAKPVQYVKICSLYGAGFYYIPGTDTCIKIGGWVRAEYNMNARGSFFSFETANFNRNLTDNNWRTRGIITVDTRSQTEYGTLRSYIAGGFQSTNEVHNAEVYAPRAFVQWAGFTAGLAQSVYDFYNTPAYSNTTNIWGADTGGGGQIVFAYTAQFGNGLSASISAEDARLRRTAIVGTGDGYANDTWPDVSGNLRIDQAWGSAQIMGALHNVNSGYYTAGVMGSGHPSDAMGWAVGGGLQFNLPMIGKGDTVTVEADYSVGALKYIGSGLATFNITHGATTGVGLVTDAVYGPVAPGSGDLNLTTGWSVVAGYGHHWNANWQTSLYGTYGEIDYSNAAEKVMGTAVGQSHDFNYYQIGSRTVWTPVANLDLSVDVMYNHLSSASSNIGTAIPAGNVLADQSWWQAIFRVQRNFYP